jgi:RES domain-containing protein
MQVYRVTRIKHANILDGAGSRINGGRWNNTGTPCIYTSENRALGVLEYAVNVKSNEIPPDLVIVTFKLHVDTSTIHKPTDLPNNWRSISINPETKDFGTALLQKAQNLVIKIPSVVIPEEYNYIINPAHPDIKKISVVDVSPFSFDARLKK